VGKALEYIGFRLSPSRELAGILVVATVPPSAEPEDALKKVTFALEAIAAAQPRRLIQARRYLRFIWVKRHPASRALYDGERSVCILDSTFVLDPSVSPLQVAASIVHETTHARIERCGIAYDEPRRARIERLCRKAELDFGQRLPDGSGVAERASSILACTDAEVARSADDWRQERRKAARVQVEELPLPRFLKRWLVAQAAKRVV
jgi:hypothetical protein